MQYHTKYISDFIRRLFEKIYEKGSIFLVWGTSLLIFINRSLSINRLAFSLLEGKLFLKVALVQALICLLCFVDFGLRPFWEVDADYLGKVLRFVGLELKDPLLEPLCLHLDDCFLAGLDLRDSMCDWRQVIFWLADLQFPMFDLLDLVVEPDLLEVLLALVELRSLTFFEVHSSKKGNNIDYNAREGILNVVMRWE